MSSTVSRLFETLVGWESKDIYRPTSLEDLPSIHFLGILDHYRRMVAKGLPIEVVSNAPTARLGIRETDPEHLLFGGAHWMRIRDLKDCKETIRGLSEVVATCPVEYLPLMAASTDKYFAAMAAERLTKES